MPPGYQPPAGEIAVSQEFNKVRLKIFKALNKCILSASASSNDVKCLVKIIKDHRLEDDLHEFMEGFDPQTLVDRLLAGPKKNKGGISAKEQEDSTSVLEPVENGQFIDGARLTEREAAFEEYYKARFDEKSWLKRNKLSL